jgi:cytochrome P450
MSGRETIGVPFDHHATGVDDAARYEGYRLLRERQVTRSDAHGGFWVLSRYADVTTAADDWATFSSADGVVHPLPPGYAVRQVALEQDPPAHTTFRRLYLELLSRDRVRAARDAIAAITRRRVDALGADGGGDFVAAVAVPVPIEVIAYLLGVDAHVAGRLRELSEQAWARLASIGAGRPPTSAGPAPTSLRRLLVAEAEDRRAQPRDDFLTEVAHAEVDGEPITDRALGSFLHGAVIAGHETTLAAAANLAYQLGLDPALQDRLASHPELHGRAVDESLRHRSPVQNFFRTVTHDVRCGDVHLAAGDKVMLHYGAANRDPDVFPDPERFDLDRYASERDARRHLAYGYGVHRCAGAHLADVELRALLAELAGYELTLEGEPRFTPTAHGAFLAIESLPVSLRRRPGRSA